MIGGIDHPTASAVAHGVQKASISSDNDSNYEPDSDDSDFDDPIENMNWLHNVRLAELRDMQHDVIKQEPQPKDDAYEAIRGRKYIGQDNTVWWEMPSDTETARTHALEESRKLSLPYCNDIFISKQAAFKRLFSSDIIDNIVWETNRKANEVNQRKGISQKIRFWKDTNAEEIYAFIGILIRAAAEKCNSVHVKDLFHKSYIPFYRAVMSQKRFEQIYRFLRFDDSRTRVDRLREDKLAPIRHIWTQLLRNLQFALIPSKELKIDEQLVKCQNQCSFRQHIPNSRAQYAIKIFWLVDSKTNYPVSGEICIQSNEQMSGDGFSHNLVQRLAERYLDIGINITMGKVFTSYNLAKYLCTRNTTLVGIVESNKLELPKAIACNGEAKKRGPYASAFCFSDEVALVSYTTNTKENVLVLSTAHATDAINEQTRKPLIIHSYNEHKGGVETFDQMLRNFTCKRKSNRWPMVVFHNMIDVAALAAFRLYELCNRGWNIKKSEKRKTFFKDLSYELVQPHLDTRSQTPNLRPSVKIAMDLMGYKKNQRQHNKDKIPKLFPIIQVTNLS